MISPVIVIANADSSRAEVLAAGLHSSFTKVVFASSAAELTTAVARHRAGVVIADLETVALHDVEQLRREFPATRVISTHRVPDEQMWAAALNAGATDCCCSDDVDDVTRAALGRRYKVRSQAA